ncbi:MAG: ribose-phosphate diphosphokinase [Rickettsiaceae bacterium]
MQIIAGSSNLSLTQRIANEISAEMLNTQINKFSDGEIKVQVHGRIGKDVVLVQSTSNPVNDNLLELLLLADTVKRAGATNIIAIIPYFGYSRQDKCTYKNGPISARLVAKLIESSGINSIITLDLHSSQIEGFFNIPITNFSTASLFLPILEKQDNIIMVSPDIGGVARARNYSELLGVDLAIINKSRDLNNKCTMNGLVGEVKDFHCVIVDDIIDSANTICSATDLLLNQGAFSVSALITHGVLSDNAIEKVEKSGLRSVYISDSINVLNNSQKITIVPVHELLASALSQNIVNG